MNRALCPATVGLIAFLATSEALAGDRGFQSPRIERDINASTVGLVPSTGAFARDDESDRSSDPALTTLSASVLLDSEGFETTCDASQISAVGPARIFGTGEATFTQGISPVGGFANTTSLSLVRIDFNIAEPTLVRMDATLEKQSQLGQFSSASIEFTGPFMFEPIDTKRLDPGETELSFVRQLVPGAYEIELLAFSQFENTVTDPAGISQRTAWTLELLVTCPGDCDGSGAIDFNDLVATLNAFGTQADALCDADGSGVIDFGDLVATLALFGPCD